jgi:pyruvate-formate lyase-activating enzyme
MIFDELCVLANGDVVCSCGDPSGKLVYGNVFRNPLADLYDGRRYRAMRRWQLRSEPTSWCPVIRTCCGGRVSRPEPGDRPEGRRVRTLQLEPTSHCNLACPECPVTQFGKDPSYRSDRVAFLPLETMLATVDQLPDLEKLLFYNFGEPFLHPQAIGFLRALRERRPGLTVHTSTNGLALTRDKIEAIAAEALLDRIVFSIDGASEKSYRRYRVGGRFERALANLEALAVACRRHGTDSRVEIVWQYILFEWNDDDAELAEARRLAGRLGVPLRWVVTHTRGASRRFAEGRPELREVLGVVDPWTVSTCDLRALSLERGGEIAGHLYRARLTPSAALVRVAPGGRFAVALEVANESGHDWRDPDGRRFRIGVRLRAANGALIGELPGLPLPAALHGAGGSARLPFDGRAPEQPGRYQLLVDVVEEGVAWFCERGSAPTTIDLEVTPDVSDSWDSRSLAAIAARAMLGEEPTSSDLDHWTVLLERGTPTATWLDWLAQRAPAAERADALARAQRACYAPLGLAPAEKGALRSRTTAEAGTPGR